MERAAAAIADATGTLFEGDALEFLQAVYRNPVFGMTYRMDAARSAIKFERPALQSIDLNAVVKHDVAKLTDDEIMHLISQDAERSKVIEGTIADALADDPQTVLIERDPDPE